MPTWWKCWTKSTETKKSSITLLDLSHQSLIDVPNDIFNHERTLEELYLNSNRIYDLPRQLFLCSGLRILNVCDNDLTRLPNAVQELKNIHNLDLSKNAITVVPELSELHHLNILNLSLNPLDRIPDTIYNTNSITELYLNDTNLTYIVANIGKLVNLTIFEIRENKLTTLPESISRLKKLKRLDVGQNELTFLPSSFAQITTLTELSVDLNYLEYFPESIAHLFNLVHLDISFNNISNSTHLNECEDGKSNETKDADKSKRTQECIDKTREYDFICKSALQTLYLNNNNLGHLPAAVFNMCNLTTLRVEGNFLTNINSQIYKLINLEELCLTSNNLTSLPGSLGLLKKLKVLMLDDNLLECLPKELSSCENLCILSIRNNKLTHMISDVGHLTKLTVLNVVNNRLQHLPVTILHLEKIKAIWLSATQSKPLVPLQRELYGDEVVLTCVLLPQTDNGNTLVTSETTKIKESDRYCSSSAQNKHINFSLECSTNDKEAPKHTQQLKLNRSPTPYPKQLKQMAKNLKSGNKANSNSEIKEARIITSLDSTNLDKYDSFVVYEQNVVIRQAKNTKSTYLLEKNYDNTDTESTNNCFGGNFYGEIDKEVENLVDSHSVYEFNTRERICDLFDNQLNNNTSKIQVISTNEQISLKNEVAFSTDEIDFGNKSEKERLKPYEQSILLTNNQPPVEIHENQLHIEFSEDCYKHQENALAEQFEDFVKLNDHSSKMDQAHDVSHRAEKQNEPGNNLFMENNCHLYSDRILYDQEHNCSEISQPQVGEVLGHRLNQNNYQHWAEGKPVPPPYHVARNYSKQAKYYEELHAQSGNFGFEQHYNHSLANMQNYRKTDSPISQSRSLIETPLSTTDDDRYSIQNFVDNQIKEPYVIKPKAHKLTTDHGDYHYVIQNKFADDHGNRELFNIKINGNTERNVNDKCTSDNDKNVVNENNKSVRCKTNWMFGQHKNVKVVDCTIYNIDFEIEYKKNEGVFVKTNQLGSSLKVDDKLLQIGEENIYQLISNMKESNYELTELTTILNQMQRPFQILISRQN